MPNSRNTGRHTTTNNTALFVTASVIIFCIGASVSIAAFVDDPEARIGLISLMLTQVPITAGLLRVLVVQDKVDEKTENIEAKTDKVLNGDMDAKLRQAVRHVVEERWGKSGPRSRPVNDPGEKP